MTPADLFHRAERAIERIEIIADALRGYTDGCTIRKHFQAGDLLHIADMLDDCHDDLWGPDGPLLAAPRARAPKTTTGGRGR